ncbi:MAG: tetratricopeptide repeat protein [Bifidobacteriaceae bacterium]|jgi:putative thioredoxin|nr:tetratricopeptide repeat protein [Bifidobacteriaceae bacterium]
MADAINPGISLAGAVDLSSLKHKVEAQPGQAGGAPSAGKYVIDTTESSFQAMVETSTTFPVLVFLWIPTDDRLFPLATKLADAVNAQEGKIQLSRIDIAANPSIAQALRVKGAPALFGLVGGRPMPIFQGLPSDEEISEVIDKLIPQVIALAQQSGVTGSAPLASGGDDSNDGAADADSDSAAAEQVPPAHAQAHALAAQGDFAGAAAEYKKIVEKDATDAIAQREYAKASLLARSGSTDVREARAAAAERPDDLEAQLAVADVDMIGGQVEDAFARLLDFAGTHRADMDAVRERLVSYFPMCPADDARVKRARRRIATLMY